MTIDQYMTKNVVTVKAQDSFLLASQLMKSRQIRRVPVVDDQGQVVGIITDRDIKEFSPSQAISLDVWELHDLVNKIQIGEAMTRHPITVTPDTPIEDAATLMRDEKVGGLPVIEKGKLVGIITESDIFNVLTDLIRTLRKEGRLI